VGDDASTGDAIDHAARLERSLAVLLDAQRKQFFGIATPLGETQQPPCDLHEPIQHVVGVRHAIAKCAM
jgi:hypothetical protein